MNLTLVGTNHHYAPIEVRERLSTSPARLAAHLRELKRAAHLSELTLLSTCNRTEIYAAHPVYSAEEMRISIVSALSEMHGLPRTHFESLLYCKTQSDAVRHLFRVVSGLDSIAVGEAQILGQIREAFRVAQEEQTVDVTLTALFQQALSIGKRIQTETELGKGSFSIGHAAVDLASKIFDDLSQATVLILGAGKMSELTAQQLVRNNVKVVFVANRTYERASELAEKLGGTAIPYDRFPDYLVKSDIVISSTAAPHPILGKSDLLPVMKKRRGKPLFLVDIALPRDIEANVSDLENVYLYNIDSLQEIVAEQSQNRSREIALAEQMVQEETEAFLVWKRSRDAAPAIGEIRSRLETIRLDDMAILGNKLRHLSERELAAIETATKAMMNHVSREAILQLKADTESLTPRLYSLEEAARLLFGVKPEAEMKEIVQGFNENQISANPLETEEVIKR